METCKIMLSLVPLDVNKEETTYFNCQRNKKLTASAFVNRKVISDNTAKFNNLQNILKPNTDAQKLSGNDISKEQIVNEHVNSPSKVKHIDSNNVNSELCGSEDKSKLSPSYPCMKERESLSDCRIHICGGKESNCDDCYKCEFCDMSFSESRHLNWHLKNHKRNNCKICSAHFTKRKTLCKHLQTAHHISEPEKVYKCRFCDKQFSKKPSLNSHYKKHADGYPVCEKCGIIFDNDDDYSNHVRKQHQNLELHCTLCDKGFLRRQQYNQHMLRHERYACSDCRDVAFPTKKQLHKHQHTVHGIPESKKKHECLICHKLFLRPKHLLLHQGIHTGEKPVQCSHCEKSFCNLRSLMMHQKSVRHLQKMSSKEGKAVEIEKTFLCSECGVKYYRQQSLLRHIKLAHTDRKSFKCSHCDYSTKCKQNFKRHVELHTGERRYVCEKCGSSFHALATLKEHHSYVHSESRSFICEICRKGFKSKSCLHRHLRSHNKERPYKCHCNRDYKRLSHLKRHMITAHQSKNTTQDEESNLETVSNNALTKVDEGEDHCENLRNPDSEPVPNIQAENFTSVPATNMQANVNANFPVFEICLSNSAPIADTVTSPQNYCTVNLSSNLNSVSTNLPSNSINEDRDTKHPANANETCIFLPLNNIQDYLNNNLNPLFQANIANDPNLSPMFNLTSNAPDSLLASVSPLPSELPSTSTETLTALLPSQNGLKRSHSLPNLALSQSAAVEDDTRPQTHNFQAPICIPTYLLQTETSSNQETMDPINSSKNLFEEPFLPPYNSNNHQIISTSQSDQLFSQSRASIWSNSSESNDSNDTANSFISSSVPSMSSFSLASSISDILSHNLIFCNDSLTVSLDTGCLNADGFESLSTLC